MARIMYSRSKAQMIQALFKVLRNGCIHFSIVINVFLFKSSPSSEIAIITTNLQKIENIGVQILPTVRILIGFTQSQTQTVYYTIQYFQSGTTPSLLPSLPPVSKERVGGFYSSYTYWVHHHKLFFFVWLVFTHKHQIGSNGVAENFDT